MRPEDIIIAPIITEKSNMDMQEGKYTFEVNKKATKVEIAKAVEKLFEVKVLNVNTMIVKGKTKRVRYQEGKTPDWKKAIVTIDTNPSDKTYLGKGGKEVKEPKTNVMVKALTSLKVEGKTLIILSDKNENVLLSSRNIEGVKTIELNTINVFDLLNCNKLVLPLDTVKKLEEVYA